MSAVTHAVMCLSSNGGGTFFIYVYVCFVGNVAVSIWLASARGCPWTLKPWTLNLVWLILAVITLTEWGYHYECQLAFMDYMAHNCMIIICITSHISVWLLTINSNQCECLAISVYVWQSECTWVCTTYKANFLLKLFLLFFLVVK